MKEHYFQPNTIGPLSSHWLEIFGNSRKDRLQPLRIEKAALLILDMQEYFLDPDSHAYIPSAEAIIPNLNRLIDYFRKADRPVFATRHANTDKDARRMATWWSELLTPDHPRGGLDLDLAIEPSEIIIKAQYDAFHESDLGRRLVTEGVEQLLIGGVMTHLCCETTARAAFVRGYEVFFLVDGTATYTEAYHQGTLRNLAHGFAVLKSVAQILGEPS
jgi:isochorismate hydrolase